MQDNLCQRCARFINLRKLQIYDLNLTLTLIRSLTLTIAKSRSAFCKLRRLANRTHQH